MTYHGEDTAQGIGGIRADRQDRRPKHHPVQLNAAAGRWALMYAASTFAQAPQPGGGDQYYPKVDSRNEISAAFRCAAVIRRSSSSSTGPCHPTRLCCSQNAPGLEERRGTSHFWDLFMAQNCFYFGAIYFQLFLQIKTCWLQRLPPAAPSQPAPQPRRISCSSWPTTWGNPSPFGLLLEQGWQRSPVGHP